MQKLIMGVVVVVVLLAGAWYFVARRSQGPTLPAPPPAAVPQAATPPAPAPTPPVAPSATPQPTQREVTIEMTASGFSPQTVTIAVGTAVRFLNRDTVDHWPASAPHPIHNICPNLDARQAVKPGQSAIFTFQVAKECPYHDHLNPAVHGTIIVKP